MKQLAVLSGKGGTGKTTVAASLCELFSPALAVDCDVDAANLALLLPGKDHQVFTVKSGFTVSVAAQRCSGCGACLEACRFGAVAMVDGCAVVSPLSCEGCSACSLVCPSGAVSREPKVAGAAWLRSTPCGPLVHAELAVGQDNSGHLVSFVREQAAEVAERVPGEWMILDGPPGLGCPVQSTLVGVDEVLIVTEPSASGLSDLERLFMLLGRLKLPAAVVVNKWDLAADAWVGLVEACEAWGVPVAGKIPFHEEVPRCLARGQIPMRTIAPIRAAFVELADWLEQGDTTPAAATSQSGARVPAREAPAPLNDSTGGLDARST